MANENSHNFDSRSSRLHTNAIRKLNEPINTRLIIINYCIVLFVTLMGIVAAALGLLPIVVLYICFYVHVFIYFVATFLQIFTRAFVMIIDLLSRIEYNTRK